ncbi:MAG: sigma-70 family RNA polymerase sigma factor [Chloroflexi bacterium]|nr:sigma-70 family RNA polymerase sigma factor [Chloroflexota bacterium]
MCQSANPVFEVQSLIPRIQGDDEEDSSVAWGIFYDTYKRYVFKHIANGGITGSEAQEVAGDIWAVIVEKIQSYEQRGIPVKYWISSICMNKIFEHRRQLSKTDNTWMPIEFAENLKHAVYLADNIGQRTEAIKLRAHITDALGQTEALEKNEFLGQVEVDVLLYQAMGSLNETERMVVILRHFFDLQHAEIAEMLNKKPNTVRGCYRRARNKLSKYPGLQALREL